MATYIKTIKDNNGDTVLPRTNEHAVVTGDGSTTLNDHLTDDERHVKITYGTAAPTGGSDGDVYLQYE